MIDGQNCGGSGECFEHAFASFKQLQGFTMRNFICTTLFMLAAGTFCGCSNIGAQPATAPTTQAAAMDAKSWVMQSGGTNVLKLTTPADVTCKSKDGMLGQQGMLALVQTAQFP